MTVTDRSPLRWITLRPMNEPRHAPRCALLEDGRVRVEGGEYWDTKTHRTRTAGVEIYSPLEDVWTPGDAEGIRLKRVEPRARTTRRRDLTFVTITPALGPAFEVQLITSREAPALTLLASGDVLVTGGFNTTSRMDGEENDHSEARAELIDVVAHTVREAGKLDTATHAHTTLVLPSGAVMVIGGNKGDDYGSDLVQLGVPEGLPLERLGGALTRLAEAQLGEQERDALVTEASRLRKAGDNVKALEVAQGLLARWPDQPGSWRALGLAHYGAGRFADAVPPFEEAVSLEPDSPFALVELADALTFADRKAESIPVYRRVVELCADDPTWTWSVAARARSQLQFLELSQGGPEQVKQVAKGPGAEATSPEWNNAGVARLKLGKPEQAREAFEKAIEVDRTNDYAWGNLATVLLQLKRPKEALAAADTTLELRGGARHKTDGTDERAAGALLSKGIALYELGRFDESVKAYDAALKLADQPAAWNNRGNSLAKLGRVKQAMASYDKAAARGFAMAWWGRACVWALKGDVKKARTEVAGALERDASMEEAMRADPELETVWRGWRR